VLVAYITLLVKFLKKRLIFTPFLIYFVLIGSLVFVYSFFDDFLLIHAPITPVFPIRITL